MYEDTYLPERPLEPPDEPVAHCSHCGELAAAYDMRTGRYFCRYCAKTLVDGLWDGTSLEDKLEKFGFDVIEEGWTA